MQNSEFGRKKKCRHDFSLLFFFTKASHKINNIRKTYSYLDSGKMVLGEITGYTVYKICDYSSIKKASKTS